MACSCPSGREGALEGGTAEALPPGDLGTWLMMEPGAAALTSVSFPVAQEGGPVHKCEQESLGRLQGGGSRAEQWGWREGGGR